MPRLRALTSWADRKQGDEFDASDADARLLCAADAIGGQKAVLVDRQLKPAESESQKESEPESPANKQPERRRYMRRDLRAQS